MTKPKAKVKKTEAEKPIVPLKKWDSRSDIPLSDIGIGDEIESMHHGTGVVANFIGGTHPIQIKFAGDRMMTYTKDGKYFDSDSKFFEKDPALKIIKKAEENKKEGEI